MSAAVEGDDATFADQVLAARVPVLVDFRAPWCGPCRLVSPIVDALGEELAGRLMVARVDVDRAIVTAGRLAVFSLPTLVLFDGGREIERVIGLRPRAEIAAMLGRYLEGA